MGDEPTDEAGYPVGMSPWRPTIIITVTVMMTELLIMLAIENHFMSGVGKLEQSLLDAALLGAILSPVVYYLLMSPLRRRTIFEQHELHELHDELTGLPTRKLFMELVGHETKLAARNGWAMSLIVIDPARLSEINQIFGYAFGDRVLVEMGSRFKALMRESDIIARISGDEFGLLLQQVDTRDVRQVVRKITAALETQFLIDGVTVDIGVTMGIAVFPHHGDDTSQLLQRARVALSTAKNKLDTYSLFEQEYESEAEDRIRLFGKIRQAIVRDEFELYYQPKVHMPTGRIVGAEALARLRKEPSQRISHFILFAEQVGIITDITRWVFRHAVAQLASWRDDGLQMNLSINISVRDILNDKLMGELLTLCEERDVSPAQITIEITESSILRQADKAMTMLERLRGDGFRISLDDFGTGYSSLSYLKQIPADELKIDQSFVRSIGEREGDDVLIGLIIDIGQALGLKLVAEGVETEHQAQHLLALGCDTFQGYMISRPLPAGELVQWHRHWTETHR